MAARPLSDAPQSVAIDMKSADEPGAGADDKAVAETLFVQQKGLLLLEAASTVMSPPTDVTYAKKHQPGEERTSAPLFFGPRPVSQSGALIPGAGDQAGMHFSHQAKPANFWFVRAWRRVLGSLRAYGANVRRQPLLMLGPPLLLFTVCVALGVYGVIAGAEKEADDRRAVVYGSALDWAASFKLALEKTFTPLVTLSIFIRQDTDYTKFAPKFPGIADDLLASLPANSIQELQISPFGIIAIIYPYFPNSTGRFNADIFAEPALRGGAIATLEARKLMLNGPLFLVNGGNFAAIVRQPIFIENSSLNDTFGYNKTLPTNCTDLCWNPETREKFWGFVTAIVPLDDLRTGKDPRLDLLKQKNLNYRMTRPYTSTEDNPRNLTEYTFANSSRWPADPVSVLLTISNAEWTLYLEPEEGWEPSWFAGMIVLVVLGSTVLTLLVAVIMASWAQQRRLLGEVMESNAALAATTHNLEEEKLRLDALLVRQYNLLSVLGGGSESKKISRHVNEHGESTSGSPMGGSMASNAGLTLERIEMMRRQLAVNTNSSSADIESIQTLDLLGEGTFGKVYKGLWRGTVVAVKTMMLPANMSGTEKREKMAVMEAAISSSLSHPNIVQTYTYAIRPIRDNEGAGAEIDNNLLVTVNTADSVANASMIKTSTNIAGTRTGTTNHSSSSVHSYEVRLVLEFCDKGCLRDALDDGAFMGAAGLNYCAVLDIAADVAKAMLHLHSLNVLHADLKARNIMLKSEGGHGSSVIAKVADFGLSLKMDHLETHISAVFQGTMTHMAPEILLEGRVSKAADVYAFGITMWELFTGGQAFHGVPRALLGHQITKESLRPRFPDITPASFRTLAERCWHPLVEMRPQFEEVLDSLLKLRSAEAKETLPLALSMRPSRSISGGIVMPTAGGVSAHAPPGECHSEGDWGKTATVIRQRPVPLPKIHEDPALPEEEENSGGAGGVRTPTISPSVIRSPSGKGEVQYMPLPQPPMIVTGIRLNSGGQGEGDMHHAMELPSGMQVVDASYVSL